jgi:hypothetical protein
MKVFNMGGYAGRGVRILLACLLALLLAAGLVQPGVFAASKLKAASANSPVLRTVTYKGKGKVLVVFREKVKYKNPKVTVKDRKGRKLAAKIVRRGGDSVLFQVRKYTNNQKYTFRIKGIKNHGFKKYTSVYGSFYVSSPEKVVVEKIDYDADSGKVIFRFRNNVEWKSPSVRITLKSKTYSRRIIDRDAGSIEVKVKPLKYGKTYLYRIKGVRVKGADNYTSVEGKFRAVAG